MRKIIFFTALAFLCLNFYYIQLLHAQDLSNQKAKEITPIKPGQQLPNELWNFALTAISKHQEKQLFINDFRGKAIILDFWASWCGVCLKKMPELDSVFRQNSTSLQVLMINAESASAKRPAITTFIRRYLTERPDFKSPVMLYNTAFKPYLPFKTVPHYVWIGADGCVKGITGYEALTAENIERFLNGVEISLPSKIKV